MSARTTRARSLTCSPASSCWSGSRRCCPSIAKGVSSDRDPVDVSRPGALGRRQPPRGGQRCRGQTAARGLSPCSTNTSAHCQARARLPLAFFSTLARKVGELIGGGAAPWWHWRGRRVRLSMGPRLAWPTPRRLRPPIRDRAVNSPAWAFPCVGS
jgi:hypothetical protein